MFVLRAAQSAISQLLARKKGRGEDGENATLWGYCTERLEALPKGLHRSYGLGPARERGMPPGIIGRYAPGRGRGVLAA